VDLSSDSLRDDDDDDDDDGGDCDEYRLSEVHKLIRCNRKIIAISDCRLPRVSACLFTLNNSAPTVSIFAKFYIRVSKFLSHLFLLKMR
jgi:hypothetical protein